MQVPACLRRFSEEEINREVDLGRIVRTSEGYFYPRIFGGVAISAANKIAEKASSPGTSFTTAGTLTPTANRLYMLSVSSRVSSGTALAPTVTGGGGLTWVQVRSVAVSGNTLKLLTVFRAMKSSGLTSGTVTVDFGSQSQQFIAVSIDEFDAVNTSGTDGSGAIVQSNQNGATTGTTATVTLAAFADATNNAAFMATFSTVNNVVTPESPYTELSDQSITSGLALEVEWNIGQDTSVTSTWTSSNNWCAIACEIAALGSTPKSDTDANGSTTEAATETAAIPGTDANGTTTEAATETAALPQTDSGAGSDVISGRASATADSGTGSEVATIQITVTDSGSGTEVTTATAQISDTDSGAGSEAATEIAQINFDLFPHGSFESGDSLTGWVANACAIARDNAQAHGGAFSQKVTPANLVTPTYHDSTKVFTLTGNTQGRIFRAAYWVYHPPGANWTQGRVVVRESGGVQAFAQAGTLWNVVDGWNFIVTDYVIQQPDRTALSCIFLTNGYSTSPWWLDDAQLLWFNSPLLGDTGTGSEATTTAAQISSSDSGTGTEAISDRTVTLPDTGTGSEVAALTVAISDTDSGTGTETETAAVPISGTDSGSGAEDQTLAAALVAADTGTDSEEISDRQAVLTDTGTSDEVATPAAAISDTDTGTSVETETRVVSAHGVDSGLGAEVQVLRVRISDTDSGTATEVQTAGLFFSSSDAGTGAEVEELVAAISRLDSAHSTESADQLAALATSDNGTDSEIAIPVSAVLANADTGGFQDAGALHVYFPDTERGYGIDNRGVLLAVYLSADSVTDSENGILHAAYSDTDAGTDDEFVEKAITDPDAGSISEVSALAAQISADETGAGADSIPTWAVSQEDSGTSSDAEIAKARYADQDYGTIEEFIGDRKLIVFDISTGTETWGETRDIPPGDLNVLIGVGRGQPTLVALKEITPRLVSAKTNGRPELISSVNGTRLIATAKQGPELERVG